MLSRAARRNRLSAIRGSEPRRCSHRPLISTSAALPEALPKAGRAGRQSSPLPLLLSVRVASAARSPEFEADRNGAHRHPAVLREAFGGAQPPFCVRSATRK